MKNRIFKVKQIEFHTAPIVFCFKCIHRNKCECGTVYCNKGCGSFKKKAGIKKRRRSIRNN